MVVAIWVLLQPPVNKRGEVEVEAPLADWLVNGKFATEEQCRQNKSDSEGAVAYGMAKEGGTYVPAGNVVWKSRCIGLDELKKLLRPASSGDLLD